MPIETIIPEVRPPQQVKIEPERPVEQLKVASAKFEIPIKVNPLKPDGIVKTAETLQIQSSNTPAKSPIDPPRGIAAYEWEGIPIDILRTFSVELGTISTKDLQQLKDITQWAKSKTSDDPTVGNMLQKIAEIRRQVGSPSLNEKAYSKIWEYVKWQKVADEAVKRQEALRSSRWLT